MHVLRRSKVLALATAVGVALLFDAPLERWSASAQSPEAAETARAPEVPVVPPVTPHRRRPKAQAAPQAPAPHQPSAQSGVAGGEAATARAAKRKDSRKPPVAVAQPAPAAKKPPPLTRPDFTEEDQQAAEVPGFAGVRFWASSAQDYARAVPQTPGPWLVLSSGGEDGAYGAGFLNGWTAAGNRPDFPVVTGISTGALMAVYAFAGPKYDALLRAAYTSVSAGDIFEVSPTPESLMDTWPLKRLIDKNVTPELLADVAAQYKLGRRLFVLTTNLDAGRPVAWDLGAIAQKGGEPALALFRKVLLASASIPGEFQPVYIEAEANGHKFLEMHVDGGVNGPMWIAPESYLFASANRRLPMSQLYILLNGKVKIDFYPPLRTTATILGRSISLALQMGARTDLALFYQAAHRDGVDFNLTLVDSDFGAKARGAFDPKYMKSLYDLGFDRGKRNQFLKEPPFRRTTAVSEGAGSESSQPK